MRNMPVYITRVKRIDTRSRSAFFHRRSLMKRCSARVPLVGPSSLRHYTRRSLRGLEISRAPATRRNANNVTSRVIVENHKAILTRRVARVKFC